MYTQTVENHVDVGQMVPFPKLFVVGCPCSGTSLLASLIAKHPAVAPIPTETHLYRSVYEPFSTLPKWSWKKRLNVWPNILRRYGLRPLLFGFRPKDIWSGILRDYKRRNRLNQDGLHGLVTYGELIFLMHAIRLDVPDVDNGLVQAEELIAALLEAFFIRFGTSGQTVLEKTSMHIRYGEQILWRFPEARMIEVVRDGRDVCAHALAQKEPWAQTGTADAIRQWQQYIEWGEALRQQPPLRSRVHRVRYEDLKADPDRCLQRIFEFAKLPCTDRRIRSIVKAVTPSRMEKNGERLYLRSDDSAGEWKNQLSEADITMCNELAGEQLAKLGYRSN